MKFLNKIIDFILFRYSFTINTSLNSEKIKQVIIKRFESDKSFFLTKFISLNFTFSHKNFLPELYNYSPIYFEGEIKTETKIYIVSKIMPLFFWIFVLAIGGSFIGYYRNFGEMRDAFPNSALPFHPLYIPTILVLPYSYYAFKIYDVKTLIKNLIKNEEKRATTSAKNKAG